MLTACPVMRLVPMSVAWMRIVSVSSWRRTCCDVEAESASSLHQAAGAAPSRSGDHVLLFHVGALVIHARSRSRRQLGVACM